MTRVAEKRTSRHDLASVELPCRPDKLPQPYLPSRQTPTPSAPERDRAAHLPPSLITEMGCSKARLIFSVVKISFAPPAATISPCEISTAWVVEIGSSSKIGRAHV